MRGDGADVVVPPYDEESSNLGRKFECGTFSDGRRRPNYLILGGSRGLEDLEDEVFSCCLW
jgi:hypothetical protein